MDKELIRESDTVYEVINKYPGIDKCFVEISSNFKKLNNPAIFNTVARLTTIQKASQMGKVYLNEMLYELNDFIGLGAEYLESKKKEVMPLHSMINKTDFEAKAPPEWLSGAKNFEVLDYREKGEPFFEIAEIAKKKKSGEGFIFMQSFEPIPLIQFLESLGFAIYTQKEAGDSYRMTFYKK